MPWSDLESLSSIASVKRSLAVLAKRLFGESLFSFFSFFLEEFLEAVALYKLDITALRISWCFVWFWEKRIWEKEQVFSLFNTVFYWWMNDLRSHVNIIISMYSINCLDSKRIIDDRKFTKWESWFDESRENRFLNVSSISLSIRSIFMIREL